MKRQPMLIGFAILIICAITFFVSQPTKPEQASKKLYFYNWSEYITDELIEQFEKETGIDVILTTYDSNEVMYAKLKMLNGEGYDLAVPSTYFVSRLRDEQLIQPLDKTKITNFTHLDSSLLNKPYDPNNTYSLPYIWGATGIGVNSDYINPKKITSWKDLWDPNYKNQLLLMNDSREVFHMALRINGHSGNSTNPKEIKQAYELLKKLMPSVAVFNSDTPAVPYLAEDVRVGMIWNGSVFMAQKENPAIQIVYPKEGAIFWMDNIVIPKQANNIDEAYAMINFLLRPDVAAKISEEIGYPTPNASAKKLLPPALQNNQAIYPPQSVIKAGEFQADVGDAITLYQTYWEKLRAEQ